MEDWFTFGLEERFADFIVKKRLGIPTVRTQVDFVGPARFGDSLRIELRVLKLGRSSIELGIDAFVGDQPCFKARHTVCCFSQHTFKAVAIPDDLRGRMEEYVVVLSNAPAQ
jgi:4-hydroxybenzoyl-CoA thioesterase